MTIHLEHDLVRLGNNSAQRNDLLCILYYCIGRYAGILRHFALFVIQLNPLYKYIKNSIELIKLRGV